jgi:uncharacterized OB-fold protein
VLEPRDDGAGDDGVSPTTTPFGDWISRPQTYIAPEVQPFWDGLKATEFRLCRCGRCGRHFWPYTVCPDHDDIPDFDEMAWSPCSGRGEVFTYVIVHKVVDAAYAAEVPYALAMVKLDEGPLFPTRITDCRHTDVHIGMRVRITLVEDPASGNVWPMFSPEPIQPGNAPN